MGLTLEGNLGGGYYLNKKHFWVPMGNFAYSTDIEEFFDDADAAERAALLVRASASAQAQEDQLAWTAARKERARVQEEPTVPPSPPRPHVPYPRLPASMQPQSLKDLMRIAGITPDGA
jgi:hypothetical protein